jgi:hypothetical protein
MGVLPPSEIVSANSPSPTNSHQYRFRRQKYAPSAASTSTRAPTYSTCSLKPFAPRYVSRKPCISGTASAATSPAGMEYEVEYS